MTYRMLAGFIDRLPGESAYKTAVRDALADEQLAELAQRPRTGHGPWSRTDLLIADTIDTLRGLIYATYAAQGGKPKAPDPYPRPGVATRKKRIGAEQMAHLQRLREEHARLHGYDLDTG